MKTKKKFSLQVLTPIFYYLQHLFSSNHADDDNVSKTWIRFRLFLSKSSSQPALSLLNLGKFPEVISLGEASQTKTRRLCSRLPHYISRRCPEESTEMYQKVWLTCSTLFKTCFPKKNAKIEPEETSTIFLSVGENGGRMIKMKNVPVSLSFRCFRCFRSFYPFVGPIPWLYHTLQHFLLLNTLFLLLSSILPADIDLGKRKGPVLTRSKFSFTDFLCNPLEPWFL